MLRKVVRGSILTGVGISLLSAFEYLYVILAGNLLPPEEFGRLNTAIALLAILLAVATAGIGTSVAKFVAEREDPQWQSSCISSGLVLQIGVAAVLMVLLAWVAPISRNTGMGDMADLLFVLVASFPLLTLAAMLPFAFLGLERIISYNAAMVMNVAVRTLALWPLVYWHPGAKEAFIAFVFGGCTATIFCLFGTRDFIRRDKVRPELLRRLLIYSLPVAISSLLVILFARADVLMLKLLLPEDVNLTVAQYSAPAVLARGVFYLSSAVAISVLPAVSKAGKIPLAKIGRLMAALAGLHLAIIALAARFDVTIIELLFPTELEELSYLMPYIVLAMALLSQAHLAGTVLVAAGRPGASAVAFALGFAVFVLCSLLLIPGEGVWIGGWEGFGGGLGAGGVVISLVAGSAVALIAAAAWLFRLREEPFGGSRELASTLRPMIDGGP